MARIALRVRPLRASDGATLQELAARSAVAESTIQQVEKGQMTPSAAVLLNSVRVLGRAGSDFLVEPEESAAFVHLCPDDRPRIGPGAGTTLERLAGDSLHFKAQLGFSWENPMRSPATFSLTGTLPEALRASIQNLLSGRSRPHRGTPPARNGSPLEG